MDKDCSGQAAHAVAGQVERGVRPHALAEALRGIADGLDQQRPWFRPDPLVMSTLRRAADELDAAGDAVAAERERCAKLCEPTKPRPCDCERCDCGNATDARMVAEWDEAAALTRRIRGA